MKKAKGLKAKVISVRWIDINKGDSTAENYRSRLVAREIKTNGRPDLFAATPPLEALKVVLSLLTSNNRGEKLMVNDVSRAYFCAPARRQVFVELPPEDKSGEEDLVGELNFSMYGTRDAAQNWAEEYSSTLAKAGYERGIANPCLFHHKGEEHDLCRKHTGELGIAERERYVEVLTLDCLGEDRALYEDEEFEVSTTQPVSF